MGWFDEEEKLEPMPPPPAPKTRPNTRRIPSPHPRTRFQAVSDVGDLPAPQSPPAPHTHPLVALSNESARNVKLQREGGGMAMRSSQRLFRHPIVTGKRLDPMFLSRDRVKAFTDRQEEEPQQSANPFAVETEHSSRIIALQLQRQAEEIEKAPIKSSLGEEEKTIAATEASARRHDLLQSARQQVRERKWSDEDTENSGIIINGRTGSALARASERKVRKQLNPRWVQSRQDASNRPKRPQERPEERHLRETLVRTTPQDLLRSGVLYDEADAARNAAFEPLHRPQLPVVTKGIVGLAGCYFEEYDT
ncbi:uncharacterized protein PITG_06987 [Phytophthora infestans T30-4]|uniref:Uncharacterized protein n=2 Tax=Phytophthora infestans TaxID=4787 RepID=D0N6Z3_PHYIT|nr:uncharacterized protein PITG_06987 [Phytophthora infestans T30-4]EEY53342.1 conserved hypothetical protein [Phytophthora infestans T30-4]KAF4043389.1 hypothetical protein GN244_ATG04259 [Phytophthora infestans]KAF4144949.1 hypothetical protein GN958_ATG05878 [Phytophthora infestans]|eukprot:XP_002904960.1 conserved hypothetical protein [Phytophthora infestans T30-4]